MNETVPTTSTASIPASKKAKPWQRLLPFAITAACFAYLYTRLSRAAAAEGSGLLAYLAKSFENVNWPHWLALMIPYCFLYLLIDSLVVWSVINWFNAKIRYADILPIRASAYILSLVNEQVSKGAIALYLNRRDGVPGWEVGSSMLFLMFCEYYSLMLWATIGVLLRWSSIQNVFHVIPWIALGSGVFFVFFHLFFSGKNRRGDRFARPPDLPRVPAGESVAVRSGDCDARAAGHRRRDRLYAGFEALRRHGQLRRNAGISAGDFLWSGHARADALGRDPFLGSALSRQAGTDDRVWIRHAQFLHLL